MSYMLCGYVVADWLLFALHTWSAAWRVSSSASSWHAAKVKYHFQRSIHHGRVV